MTEQTKLSYIKNILNISDNDSDELLNTYLDMAKSTILELKYNYLPEVPKELSPEDEMIQVYSVIAGFNNRGNENMTGTTENGITSQYKYSDMLAYIKNNIIPYAKVCL